MIDTICKHLEELKGENIVTIDVAGKSSITDTLIIVSGRSIIHNRTLARSLINGEVDIQITYQEGMDTYEWIVLATDTIMIHIMTPEARSYYHLEDLWDTEI